MTTMSNCRWMPLLVALLGLSGASLGRAADTQPPIVLHPLPRRPDA